MDTKDLINIIFNFCQLLAYGSNGGKLFPFQAQLSKRVIRSLLEDDGEEITGLQARQSGKSETISVTVCGCAVLLPILASMPMFADDPRLIKFKTGIRIGIFAPALQQSKIIFNRVKKYLSTDSATEVLTDPEIMVSFGTNNGENISLKFANLDGVESVISCLSASDGANIVGNSFMLLIIDEAQEVGNSKYAVDISPMGAYYNATTVLIGTPFTSVGFFYSAIQRNKADYLSGERKRNHFEYNYEAIIKYNPSYKKYIEKKKKSLGETSDQFQMSYNLKWILERGMFIEPKKLDQLLDDKLGRVLLDHKNDHVAGIDFGKKNDSTIVTVGQVDFENPIIIEESDDPNIPDYVVHDVIVKNWLEIQGDNWDAQYNEIKSFLENYRLRRIVADATGVGSGIVDRIMVNFRDVDVIPFVFSTPAKSDLYKHYDKMLKSSHVTFPNDEETRETHEFKRFYQQHVDLLKGYSGQHMVCCHGTGKEDHDDYPDSGAMMAYAAKGEGTAKPQEEENTNVYKSKVTCNYYKSRNRVTARRGR